MTTHLVDLGPAVLGPFTESLQGRARVRLEEMGVQLHLGTGVKGVREDSVTLSDDTAMPAQIVVWAGGMKADSVVATTGLPTGRGGLVDVQPDLSLADFDRIYVLGDAANIPDGNGGTQPQLGSVALQSGTWASKNIVAGLESRLRKDFKHVDKGFMAMVGRMAAVAEVGPKHHHMHGAPAFAAWLAVHVYLLPINRSRVGALTNWTRDHLSNDRTEFVVGNEDHR